MKKKRSGQLIVVGEPKDMGEKFELQDVSTYVMLVMHNFLATREADNMACKDVLAEGRIPNFAHENVNFLTWHCYYLLIVEREFHRIAKSFNSNDFALAYYFNLTCVVNLAQLCLKLLPGIFSIRIGQLYATCTMRNT